ncbi:hypothetical protein CLV53_10617 [Sediminibacterium magnilacihabitans]|jgi:hypothetical protein|nr:hypothetical protein CLV53_10617 [Sediminibacterium magnilacihabitans]
MESSSSFSYNMRIELNHIVEFISLLAAIWNYKFLKGTIYEYFVWYIGFILYAELGASYFKYALNHTYNMHIYLWVGIVDISFKSYFLYSFIRSRIFKRIIIVCASVIVCYFLFLFFFFQRFTELFYYGMSVGSYYLTLLCCVYFFELFVNSEEEILWSLPSFWIVAGTFIFFTGISLSFVMHKILAKPSVRIFNLPLYNFIPQLLSVILYGAYVVAFVLVKKKKQAQLLSSEVLRT